MSGTIFPGEVLNLLVAACTVHFHDDPPTPLPPRPDENRFSIVERPLRDNDPARAIGIFATDWGVVNDEQAWEIGGAEPTLQRYLITIQLMVRGSDQIEARDEAMTYNKLLRAILYRDPALLVPLRALSETLLGATERFQRFDVNGQRFLNAELASNFAYLSTTQCTLETETQET